jgi:hypothetical protein
LIRTHGILWSCGEENVPLKTEESIDVIEELYASKDFLLNLISPTEDVGVILLEPAHSGKPGERTTDLIPMQHAEISESDRQFLVGMSLVFENQAMSRAIHGLQAESLPMRLGTMLMATICILAMVMSFNHKEIFLVVLVVS